MQLTEYGTQCAAYACHLQAIHHTVGATSLLLPTPGASPLPERHVRQPARPFAVVKRSVNFDLSQYSSNHQQSGNKNVTTGFYIDLQAHAGCDRYPPLSERLYAKLH
jgi:hypothetical protein